MIRRIAYTPYFTASLLILTLTLSFIYLPIVASENSEEIISKLKELQEDISGLPLDEAFENIHSSEGQRKALTNKIKAVINQIEAGNYEGALNKLENDLKNAIEGWVTEDYEVSLIEKVNEIIDLIKVEDTTPPNITSVSRTPETPNYDEDVTVIAQVEDEQSGVDLVILSYSSNMVDWTNLTMNLEDDFYLGEIPAQPYNTSVSYKVHASDRAGNSAVSDTYSYLVIDSYPPLISWVERSPISPNYNDTVLVTASVSELEEASGVHLVILSYSDGDSWTNATMTLKEETIYEGSIPMLPYGTTVEYIVYASDNSENSVASGTYSYIVGDEYPPTARIDRPTSGSYVKGIVEIAIFVYDDNFEIAQLSINDTIVKSWMSIGEYTYDWDTATYIDGAYILNLTARDEANNKSSVEIAVTVDNVIPAVEIRQPQKDAYINDTFDVVVYGNDTNFLQMELYISNNPVETWTTSGEQIYIWDTSELLDGSHAIKLIVSDRAGNLAETTFNVTVDNTLPTAIIHAPPEGTFLKGPVVIDVTGEDINFKKMELEINYMLVKTWTAGGSHIYLWNTEVDGTDGAYTIRLIVHDKAENSDESSVTVIVDNTLPTIRIDYPVEGSYLTGIVDVKIFIHEDNLDKAELTINGIEVVSWTSSGEHVFKWNTITYAEGIYFIKLNALDKAGNRREETINLIVDNASPIIEGVTWTPKEPSTDEQVTVNVKVNDPQPNGGIQNVTLWYRNTTIDGWQLVLMDLDVTSGNWTAAIPGQSMETTIRFYVKAFDDAGNNAVTDEYEYDVISPAGIPLAWIAAIILLILAATAAAIYFGRKRREEKQDISSRA
jgi:hypothetical protein